MPCDSCPLEKALAKTTSGKSSKKEKCCVSDCEVDCCSPAFLRLDKLREGWALVASTGNTILPTSVSEIDPQYTVNNVNNRAGNAVIAPDSNLYNNDGIPLVQITADEITSQLNNAYYAYLFVNTVRYVNFEACGKQDQVVGWLVDTSSGNLELFQALPDLNLLITDTRSYYDAIPPATLTTVNKNKLRSLNVLYKASLELIDRVSSNPKTEGNICEVVDKCGQKWLLAINRANGNESVADRATQFAIVGVPL
jgi:hypothetical protein